MRSSKTSSVALIYTLIAVIMTWPLATHLGTRLAADVGDPAFNCWVLAWTAGQVLAVFRGDFGALAGYWNGNIFSPEPLTLAYSEHLTAQMIQILPVYAATGNILLSYNLLFIASFALSGFAMYVLVRELTGNAIAAFLGGLAFAYAPYRLGQFSHLQVLTSYWMPLVIAGLHRYFTRTVGANSTAALKPLGGAAIALVFQNLSCGYYLLFFTPFVAAYSLFEMARRRLLRSGRTWLHLSLAAAAVLLLTWPFVRPYLQLRELGQLGVRSREEISLFSADTHAFGTIAPNSRLLAETLSGYPQAEGEGFVGFTILALAMAGAVWAVWRILRSVPWSTLREWHVLALGASGVLLAGSTAVLGWYFVHGQIAVTSGGSRVIYQSATQPLHIALGSLVLFVALVVSARPRVIQEPAPDPDRQSRVLETTTVFFLIALAFAALFALGPRMQALGRDLGRRAVPVAPRLRPRVQRAARARAVSHDRGDVSRRACRHRCGGAPGHEIPAGRARGDDRRRRRHARGKLGRTAADESACHPGRKVSTSSAAGCRPPRAADLQRHPGSPRARRPCGASLR